MIKNYFYKLKKIQKKLKIVLLSQQYPLHFCTIKIYPNMNYTFYYRFLFVIGLLAASFTYSHAQCSISDLTLEQSVCDGNSFWVTINFNYEQVGNEGFHVQGNGNNYGNFEYPDLPILIGPLEGDGVTDYEFVAIDNQFSDCSDFAVLGPVFCGVGDCAIFDLVLEPTDCDANGNYDLWIDFEYENPTHTHFDVIYQGDIIGYFALDNLPVVIEEFEDNGENTPFIQVCINDNSNCCAEGEFLAPNCPQGDCNIFDLHVTNVECDGDFFYITLDFEYENVGNDGFSVQGSGVNHGIFSYDDVPVTLGPLPVNGTFWEFIVKDVNHPDCSDFIEYGEVDCGGGDCNIFDLVVEVGDCNPDGTYHIWIDFEFENATNDYFDVKYQGDNIGYFLLSDLPIHITDFQDNGEPNQGILVCINDNPNCCEDVGFMAPECEGNECEFSGFFAEAHPCNGDGLYLLDFEFEAENGGGEGFMVIANGNEYGPFDYGQNFYTIGPLNGNVVYEILIQDVLHPDCTYWNEWGPVFCDDDCHIFDLHAEVSDCDDLDQFYVTLDFEFSNTGNDGYKIVGNGNVYGFFGYDDVPVTLGPFEAGATDALEFLVKDVQYPDCGDVVVVYVPDCSGNNNDCSIHDLVVDLTPCQGDGTFYAFIDFEHTNTSNIGFRVDGNGINYGVHLYDEVPLSFGPLIGNGTTPYEFVVSDLNMPDCSDFVEVGVVDCDISGDCQISDLIAVPGSCHSDGTYNLWLNFDFENATNLYFDVFYNGQIIDYFPLSSLPVVIPHFESNGEPGQEITICINDTPNCCATYSFIDPQCMGPNMIWSGDTDFNGTANHFDILNLGLAYGATGPERTVQGIEWVDLLAEDWEIYFNSGLNFKHADCDGNGTVTKEDIQAIEINYGETHGEVLPDIFLGGNEDDPPFYVDLPGGLDLTTGSQFIAPIILGNGDKPVENLYGIAFTLVFDPDIIIPSSIEMQYDPSWLGVADVNLLTFDRTFADQGRIDVALSRSDQNDVSGFGQISGFIGIIDNIAGKEEMKVEIERVRAIQGDETVIPLNRPVKIVDLSVGTEEPTVGAFEVFPNPTKQFLFLQHPENLLIENITVYDTNGKQIMSGQLQNRQIDVSSLITGVYALKIETKEGLFVERFVKF